MSDVWCVYVLRCSDDSLYCGITTDIKRRVYEHNETKRGAKYTRARRPVMLFYISPPMSRSQASSAEARFKRLRAEQKRTLLENHDKVDSFLFDPQFNIM